MENLQNKNVSSTDTTLKSTFNALTSNTQPTSTTIGFVTNDKGRQPQFLVLRKRNVDDRKNHKFGIILPKFMVILKFMEMNVIIVERVIHVILFLMEQVICVII